ncbi:peptide ABC transporter substrate-binding protein [Sporosarcina sp. Marseille-Q4063]|uniref:peptide ABC transporter substrate-binding protein n=1 Tax=Sporosarcina sp. Marseille-Q4063 TaxID=2810514 RepID=UPI001BAF9FD8|nr:peptide ABC transporter substrate-binding protein [Sporosarcina sp. Marseille-Q4063]QUW21328.1 peptide ABC transporter substrate-binding protein [Sporosarcina sp. Marseille-Q4063]
MKKRFSLVLTIMLALSIFLSGCGFSDTKKNDGDTGKDDAKEKVANLSLNNDIPDLNQVLTTDGISFSILNNVMEGLYRLGKDHNPEPAMAESVDVSDDKLTYTFHLRDGIKWSNGDPVTAEDFKYSWLRAMHPDTSGAYADILYNYIVGGEEFFEGEADESAVAIDAKDAKTLEVTLKTPTPFFLGLTAFVTYFPLNEKFIDEIGDEKFALTADSILYNGPFVMTEYNQAQGVSLEKNEHYWDIDNVDLDKATMKVIKENSTALNLYEAGDLDRVYLASADVDSYKDDAEFGTETEFISWYLQFNFLEKPFDNVNIRKAFQLAYDQEVLTKNILNNGSEPAYGLVAAGVHGNDDKTFRELNGDIIKPDYEKAKEYLAKGIEEIGGELPPLEILTADDTIAKDTATFLQSQFKKNIDVDVNIVTKPYSGRLDAMREHDYQMGISRWGSDYNDALDILDLWKGDPPRGLRGSYSSEEYMAFIDNAIAEKDEEKRLQMLMDAEKLMLVDDGTLGPLYFEGQAFLQKPYMKNYVTHPYGASVELKYITIE